MRIAVASNGLNVASSLETCTNYNYFTLNKGELVAYQNIPLLAHKHRSAVEFLKDVQIDTLIVGCLKNSDRQLLEQHGICIFCGAKGDAKQAIETYLSDLFMACDSTWDEPQA